MKYCDCLKLAFAFGVFIVLKCQETLCDDAIGWVQPYDFETVVGTDFNVTCTVNAQNEEVVKHCKNSMHFTVNGKEMKSEDINGTSIVVPVLGAPSQLKSYYQCWCDKMIINRTTISVGTRPEPVHDYSCNNYAFDYMECKFQKPPNNLTTQYQLSWGNKSIECGNAKSSLLNCLINNGAYEKFRRDYTFNLKITNVAGSVNQSFSINNLHVAIPKEPANVSVSSLSPNSICLTLHDDRISNYMFCGKLTHEVNVSLPHNRANISTDTTWSLQANGQEVCLKNLPYANYNYELQLRSRCQSNPTGWNRPYTHLFRTAAKLPERPPTVTNGSYHINPLANEANFYWAQLEQYEHNGDNLTYVVSDYRKDGRPHNATAIEMLTLNQGIIRNWDRTVRHDIWIRSRNCMGDSLNASLITIPVLSTDKLQDRMPHVLEAPTNASLPYSWKPPLNHTDLTGYTFYWCPAKTSDPNKCDDTKPISWRLLDKRQLSFAPKAKVAINIAVSAQFARTASGGMQWVLWDNKNVRLIMLHGDNSALLHSIQGIVALCILGVFGYVGSKTYRNMSDIYVKLPDGIQHSLNEAKKNQAQACLTECVVPKETASKPLKVTTLTEQEMVQLSTVLSTALPSTASNDLHANDLQTNENARPSPESGDYVPLETVITTGPNTKSRTYIPIAPCPPEPSELSSSQCVRPRRDTDGYIEHSPPTSHVSMYPRDPELFQLTLVDP